jgi:glycosyltransferase involved in cell wall biosynthesis
LGAIETGRKVWNGARHFGVSGVVRRGTKSVASRLSSTFAWDELDFPLRPGDVTSPAEARHSGADRVGGDKLRIGWVCMAPGEGSGGHTTLFRMVQALAERGHECTLLLYDRDYDDVTRHEAVIRRGWPWLTAAVASATESYAKFDAVVASSWEMAHVVASRSIQGARRFYFVQDYEPYFFPRGHLYQLAEETYHFGFHTIALGEMVARELRIRSRIEPESVVPFGTDRACYRILGDQRSASRTGIVYYAKRANDRRGYHLARAALERFHQLRPHEEIHVYGDVVRGWTVPVTNHGSLSPERLNELYNRTVAGLAMSYTNISLVAAELLAAGNIPVLNDSAEARLDLPSPFAVWAPPTAEGLARALVAALTCEMVEHRAVEAAATAPPDWSTTQLAVSLAIEARCRAGHPQSREHARFELHGRDVERETALSRPSRAIAGTHATQFGASVAENGETGA